MPIAERGVAVASASYRFTDVATYPAQVHDAKGAVRWLRAHGDEFGLATERIGAWGASAGGFLALTLGLTAGVAELEGDIGGNLDQDSSVAAVCDWFAPVDLRRRTRAGEFPVPDFAAGPPPEPSYRRGCWGWRGSRMTSRRRALRVRWFSPGRRAGARAATCSCTGTGMGWCRTARAGRCTRRCCGRDRLEPDPARRRES